MALQGCESSRGILAPGCSVFTSSALAASNCNAIFSVLLCRQLKQPSVARSSSVRRGMARCKVLSEPRQRELNWRASTTRLWLRMRS